ncbi:NAD(P)/FAD-dependent oxidoreductase [Seonamhaeicola marinus]|uniref:NAD(P)/FAD-dependent oxidoreductase n=1 Tax=Seonamhaeicola marinus TaxID=1912246 RepID=A0A5D0HUW8_9FLAO|nr:NAD(P)/FAD-dependent oxidoreductase [Seonamhaeicola marinus]TYA73937.1 NAD(P)/FAD-dependent oxidoreductase [Seonamhaeicola marinus]
MVTNVEVLIIGAGPSGCVAAAHLINEGVNVKIIEKNKFPRFVIGESLLPRCMDHFEEVGLLEPLQKIGFEIKRGARFLKNDVVCNFDFSKKFTEGWDWTWQVPRADFDSVLVNEIIKKGADVQFEQEVIDVKINSNGKSVIDVKDKSGEVYTINANFIIDSSGYGRVLPRILGLDKPSELPKHSSIFTHVKDINRPEGEEGTLITFDVLDTNTWFWVIPFSNGNTSIGFVSTTEYIDSFKGNNTERLKEMLKLSKYYYNRFKDVEFSFEPKCIKNYSKSVSQIYGKGYALTGNSAEFLDPVFSSGVTFATESALAAAKLVVKEVNGETADWEKDYDSYIKEGVGVFSSYVKEWYTGNLQTLFFHRPENPEVKRQICAVLAGYVWDKTNPFVKKHNRAISTLAHMLNMMENEKANL